MTAAARQLGVSQPSVSKVLAHAEQQLGYPLFDRVRGKIVPTREAERLIGLASSVYQGIDELKQVARNLSVLDEGRIRVAMTPAFGIKLVPGVIASYLRDHPATHFEIETLHYHQQVRALNQSRIDLGVVFHPAPTTGILAENIAEGEFVVVAHRRHGLRSSRSVRLEQLQGLPFIGLSARGPLGQLLRTELEAADTRFTPCISVETYQMAMSLVGQGAGVTIIDEITARSMSQDNMDVLRLDPPVHFNIAVLQSENRLLSRPAGEFTDFLRDRVRAFLAEALVH
jgi:DNA-binding transcriptional LysR family regulator